MHVRFPIKAVQPIKAVLLSCSALTLMVAAQSASAADLPVVAPAPAPIPTFALFEGVEYHAQFEGGILGNSNNPGDSQNVGHLFTDKANQPVLNQALVTITKAVDPKATGYAFGFTAQALFGTDERFNHFIGFADSTLKGRYQAGLIQGFLAAHLPWLTEGGVDVKAGLFTSPMGVETLDPSTSTFYSHSYIYNYGLTFNHTGILTTTHVNSTLDIYLGVDTGNQTTFGGGDPNGQPAGFAGFGLNGLLNGKLTVLALSHMGPENNALTDPLGFRQDMRFYNDVDITYKINDDWTWITELNYVRDNFAFAGASGQGASAYGIAEYLGYAINKTLTLNLRGEVFRDADGFFVANYPGGLDAVNAVKGIPNTAFNVGPFTPTTYSEFTLGLTYKPDVPKPLALVMIRPEIRYDRSLSGSTPYDTNAFHVGRSKDQFTFGGDITVGF